MVSNKYIHKNTKNEIIYANMMNIFMILCRRTTRNMAIFRKALVVSLDKGDFRFDHLVMFVIARSLLYHHANPRHTRSNAKNVL